MNMIKKKLELSSEDMVIPVSSLKKTGHDKLLDEIAALLED